MKVKLPQRYVENSPLVPADKAKVEHCDTASQTWRFTLPQHPPQAPKNNTFQSHPCSGSGAFSFYHQPATGDPYAQNTTHR